MQITLDLPEQMLAGANPEVLARRIRLYAALWMFRAREISAGAAAELAGVDRFTFTEECSRHGIALTDYLPEELRQEFELMSGRS